METTKQDKKFWFSLGLAAGVLSLLWSKYRQTVQQQNHQRRQAAFDAHPSKIALVTGASSGIGEAYARKLAGLGYNLILVARREERLKSLASDYQQRFGIQVEILAADLAKDEGIQRVEQRILKLDSLAFLVNNAGFAIPGNFIEAPFERQLEMINCHTLASTRFIHAALPGMITHSHGAIVNLSSIGAFASKPKDAIYCATKAYLITFSEALQMELANTGVQVQALCPGFTHTEFHDTPLFAPYKVKESIPGPLWMTADQVVEESLQAFDKEQVICVPGLSNRLIVTAARLGLTGFLVKIFKSLSSQQGGL